MATYYVKNGGNDGSDGLSDGNAWETIGKVNGEVFSAGDIIKFKRGSTWNEELIADNAGTGGNPVTYEDYDSGIKPTINRENGADTSGFQFQADFVTFKNFIVKNTARDAVWADTAGLNNLVCEGIDVDHTEANSGFFFQQCSYITCTECTSNDTGNNGFSFFGSALNNISHVLCTDCVAHDTRTNDGFTVHQGDDSEPADTDFVFIRCIGYNCDQQGFDMQAGDSMSMIDCESYDNAGGQWYIGEDLTTNTLIESCYAHGSGVGLNLYGDSIIVRNTLIVVDSVGVVIWGASGVDLYNNTIVADSQIIDFAATVADIVIKNNVLKRTTDGRACRFQTAAQAPDNAVFTFDYNCWFEVGGVIQFYAESIPGNFDFAAFQAYGQEANGFEGDPQLNAIYYIISSSPCKDTGIDLSGEGFSDDKNGRTRPIGIGWDMGAYEYGVKVMIRKV